MDIGEQNGFQIFAKRSQREENKFEDDGFFTITSAEQKRIEELVACALNQYFDSNEVPLIFIHDHKEYLRKSLLNLSHSYETLDASQPWIVYWIVHSLNLLNHQLSADKEERVINFLNSCKRPSGGYSGGPGQAAHLAPTYAAIMALCSLGSENALKSIDRSQLYQFLCRLKQKDGGFMMHDDGECDVRGMYCALATASITNILSAELVDKAAEWTMSCQTYEGGFSGEAGSEAHGGYTFCALATLKILGIRHLVHTSSLLNWLTKRQMRFEGGFQGRTNKLVDGCYSFWQAACFPMLKELIQADAVSFSEFDKNWFYDNRALQEYIIICCQVLSGGGFMDKPEKGRDLYHTCYNLSGLSIAQHLYEGICDPITGSSGILQPTHPVYNISTSSEKIAKSYFEKLPEIVKRWW